MNNKKSMCLSFWMKWYNSDCPQKELDEISKRIISIANTLPIDLAISSISSMLNSYFKDLFDLKNKVFNDEVE